MLGIDKAFILSFSPFHEKKKKLWEARLNSIPMAKNIPWEILELPDETTLEQTMSNGNLRSYNSNPKTSRDRQALSFAVGHWRVWQKAGNEKYERILVLEENFLPRSFHYHVLNTTPFCDLLYLGRDSNGGDTPLEGGMVTPAASNGSFAYCLHSSGISKFLRSGFDQQMIPVGDFITTMHQAPTSDDFKTLFTGHITAMAPMKNFIEKDTAWDSIDEPSAQDPAGDYKPLHPQLYNFFGSESSWVTRYLNRQLIQHEFDLICDEPIDNVYSFPLFTSLFCKEIIEEAEHYGMWTSYRGKHEDAIDMKLDSIGFDKIYQQVMQKYVFSLFSHKYQLQGDAWSNLNSQNFIVRYLSEKQGHLGLHNDGSYLSMVVTLNTDHEGGGTFFPKFKKLVKHEQPGYATVHPGLVGYLHGARPVTKGKRYILASFFFPGAKPPIAEGY